MCKKAITIVVLLLLLPNLTWAEFDETPEEAIEEPVISVAQSIPPAELGPMPQATCPQCPKCPQLIYRQPIVARVTIPARLRGGYFVARHDEYVILKKRYDQVVNGSNRMQSGAAPASEACPVRKER